MSKITQLDNLSVEGMANGAIDFFATVMANLQVRYGTDANGWYNTINDLDDIIYADHLRSTGFVNTQTALYQSTDLATNRAYFADRSDLDYIEVSAEINTSNGVISSYYSQIIPEKRFDSNTSPNLNSNVSLLTSFITNTLDNNSVYANLGVISSKQYSIDNGYINGYANINSTSFDTSSVLPKIEQTAEIKLAMTKAIMLGAGMLK